MKILKKVFSIFTRKNSIKESQEYEMYQIRDENNDFEKMFKYYNTIKVEKNNELFEISFFFTNDIDEEKRKRIFNFIKEGFGKKIDNVHFLLTSSFIFNLAVAYKAGNEENTIKLFIGDIDL